MSTQLQRTLLAALAAAVVLLGAHWFDAGVVRDAGIRAGQTYDSGPFFNLISIDHLLTAAGVVALALAAWRSRDLVVGIGYAVAGGFLALLPTIFYTFDSTGNGRSTPLAPEPIARILGDWYLALALGVTGAVFTLAGAMLISGLAVVGSVMLAGRRSANADTP
jgi:hypothetical protein